MRLRLLVIVAMLVALSACTEQNAEPEPGPDAAATSSGTAGAAPSLRQIVQDPRSRLNTVAIRPRRNGYTVAAWWILQQGNRSHDAIVVSDDGFATARYRAGTWRQWRQELPPVHFTAPPLPALKDLLVGPVTSLAPGTEAVVAGGDGATLLPFENVARRSDGGPWETFSIARTRGDQAYDESDVVLGDGRFLVLLDAWSSDRGHRPGPEHHGLWVSDGDDWSTYAPYRPRFSPHLRIGERVTSVGAGIGTSTSAPQGLVVVTTSANRLYVSRDDGRTFIHVAAR